VTEDVRDRIRHLYFVDRVPLRAIAERLFLSAQSVRGALVLVGGQHGRRDPEPVIDAASPPMPAPPSPHPITLPPIPARRRPIRRDP